VILRPAEHRDVRAIARIIVDYASQGIMLPRSEASIHAALSSYLVAERGGAIVACGGLHRYSPALAEIFGLATAPGASGNGAGRAVVEALIAAARAEDIERVFALTRTPGFFEKLGFYPVQHTHLPPKIWKDCVTCGKFGNCNEIAMALDLADTDRVFNAPIGYNLESSPSNSD